MQVQARPGKAERLILILHPISLALVQRPGIASSTKTLHSMHTAGKIIPKFARFRRQLW